LGIEPGYVFVLGECGGKTLFHPAGAKLPAKYHLSLSFIDGSHLSITTQMWGAMELYERGEEQKRTYLKDMRPVPGDADFTFEYFEGLVEAQTGQKRSAKSLLTQEQLIPGLGNSIAQDILFAARLHPRHPVEKLDPDQRRVLYDSILETIRQITGAGGRYDEFDLYGCPGGYIRKMDKRAAGQPCPNCATPVQTIQYLGGSCYFCPMCQT
jgi:formamidopyrimidine-DNA glycosylase